MKKIFSILFGISMLFAQFDWNDNGIPVRQGYHIEWFRGGDISSTGEMIAVWSDTRTSTRDVYAQKVNDAGIVMWDIEGVLVAGGDGRQEDPIIISNSNGGGIISWRDYSNDPVYGELYAKSIDSNGNVVWDQILISGSSKVRLQSQQNMCSDMQGGAYVTWYEDTGAGDGNYYGVHMSANGSITEPTALIETEENYGNVSLESSGNGSAVISWKEGPWGEENIYAQRIEPNSNIIQKIWSNNVIVTEASGTQTSPKVTYYSDDYVVVVWQDQRENNYSIGANFIDNNGSLKFSSNNDIVFITDASSSMFPRVKATSEGAFVVWLSASDEHYVQKVTIDNISVWDSPVLLYTGNDQEQARLSVDNNGGVYITWEDDNSIAVQYLNSDGDIPFMDPLILSSVENEQFYPLVRTNGSDGAYIIWANGSLSYNGIGSLGLHYEYVDLSGSILGSPVELFYGFGGQIEKGSTKSLSLDESNNLIYWQDYRNGINNPQTYGSIGGESAEFNSIKLLSNYPYQQSPQIIWSDQNTLFLSFYNQDEAIYIQRLDSNLDFIGDASPINNNGNQQASDESKPYMISNNNDEVFYAYSENPGQGTIYIHKFSASGGDLWGGRKQITSSQDVTNQKDDIIRAMFSTLDGGCIVVHDILGWPDYNVKLTRIDESGNFVENWNDINISPDGERGYFEGAVRTNDGIFVIWRDGSNNIFGKHLQYNLTNLADIEPINLSLTGSLYTESLSLDYSQESDEVFFCWQEQVGDVYNVHCKYVDLFNLSIGDEVIEVYPDPINSQRSPVISATDHSTYLVVWEDERLGSYSNLYIQEVNSSSSVFFGEGGYDVCDASFNQFNSQIEKINNFDETYITFWEDDRSSGKEFVTNIFAQKIQVNSCISLLGDMNQDSQWNVLDIVTLANCVLAENCQFLAGDGCAGDMNQDSLWNVLDIVTLANCVLIENCGS